MRVVEFEIACLERSLIKEWVLSVQYFHDDFYEGVKMGVVESETVYYKIFSTEECICPFKSKKMHLSIKEEPYRRLY